MFHRYALINKTSLWENNFCEDVKYAVVIFLTFINIIMIISFEGVLVNNLHSIFIEEIETW